MVYLLLMISLLNSHADMHAEDWVLQACVSEEEYRLYTMVNDYRRDRGLEEIPLSPSLCRVAGAHVWDLQTNNPERGRCNLHSWSDQGPWSSCCYTNDHRRAACIWSKPAEVSAYEGYGYEVAFYSSLAADQHPDMAGAALQGWKKSPGHNRMIINKYSWKRIKWKAMGVGIYGNYAVVWFGDKPDTEKLIRWCR
jgi:uncharacterized protein YkwD